jgi:ribose/xylose/arabinose/galactoside ABC-type transport system permease subunit
LQIDQEWSLEMDRSTKAGKASTASGSASVSTTQRFRAFRQRIDLNSVQVQLLVGIAVVAAVFGFLYPDRFATWRNVENMARQGGTLAVVAVGQSFALISGGFDISVAATMGLASTLGAMAMIEYGVAAGVAAGLAAGLVVGVLNGTLIARFGVTPFIATLGMLAIARGVANELSDGRSVSGIPSSFDWFGGGNWGPIPATVGIAIVVCMSIATAVIGGVAIGGGVGRLSGVILGVVLISVLSTGMNIAQLSEFTQEIVTGVVLIAAVLIDRVRLRGRQRRRVESVLHEEHTETAAA